MKNLLHNILALQVLYTSIYSHQSDSMFGFCRLFTAYFGRMERSRPPLRRCRVENPWKILLKRIQSHLKKIDSRRSPFYLPRMIRRLALESIRRATRLWHTGSIQKPCYIQFYHTLPVSVYICSVLLRSIKIHDFIFQKSHHIQVPSVII